MSLTAALPRPRHRWRHRLLAVAATSALAAGGLTVLATPASAAGVCAEPVVTGATTTITCSAGGTGSATVPDNVSSAVVTLDGAGGGNANDGAPGGKGAHVVATIPVAPGQTFNVVVGLRGASAATNGAAASGGGLVAVTTGASAPLLTAGSGGGAGGTGFGSPAFPGTPGGDSGSAGPNGAGQAPTWGGGGGGAGTATAGGAAGAAGTGTRTGASGSPGGFPNAPGGAVAQSGPIPAGFGGRGGAGYGGGGRGGGGGATATNATGGAGGGGGGGSSLVSGTVPGSPVTLNDGANAGNGSVVFVFTREAPTITSVSPGSGPAEGGTAVTVTGTGLEGADITFGPGNPATDVTCTDTTCTVTAPPGTGTVDVQATTPGGTSAVTSAGQYTYVVPAADIDVDLNAQPHLGILVPYLTYTLSAANTGPGEVTSATVTAALPAGATATNLSPGCTVTGSTVTCAYGTIANGTHTDKTFRVPLSLLSLGHVTVTGTRTASTPNDPNPANDTAKATCTVISIVLVTCP
ncbi:IPT/TIG domain-containing protein [Streptomyces sp. NBC_01498]|uniref:IPT/TIG domain-containing protein n=1 Tax=Streptomyces sp. NBC_01498 TaxID=2975870 RepID=UPI002E7C0EC8|nr:IPT/TIG domain-containing protein [Streptomyces sp. NBC_01498]WTL28595.1 IPT/TIG domain-containing protein [Streptomyces sp. NBC_01498]